MNCKEVPLVTWRWKGNTYGIIPSRLSPCEQQRTGGDVCTKCPGRIDEACGGFNGNKTGFSGNGEIPKGVVKL